MNPSYRGEEICAACGCTTGHAGYGEDSIGYVDGTIGPLCNDCNRRLICEIEVDSGLHAEIERLRRAVRVAGQLSDVIGDVDLHDTAWDVYVARTGDGSQDGEPSIDDYAEAFLRAVDAVEKGTGDES